MTDRSFLVKIIPPTGYDVYRLRVSRTALGAVLVVLIGAIAVALGVHAWQLHLAENDVRALQAQLGAQRTQLDAIDRQADGLAGELRDLQRQNETIRKLLGVGSETTTSPPAPTHAAALHVLPLAANSPPDTLAGVRARLDALADASSAEHADVARLDRLTHRVLDLRRLAAVARRRMIASIPSISPVDGTITAGFGWRVDPWPEFHRGVDLAAEYGTPVHAAADGVVVSAGWDSGFGNKVDVDHQNGYHTWYAHLSRFAVAAGTRVRKGDVIAYVGATGEATGPHLHYQVMRAGEAIDPTPFLAGVPSTVLATLPAEPGVQ